MYPVGVCRLLPVCSDCCSLSRCELSGFPIGVCASLKPNAMSEECCKTEYFRCLLIKGGGFSPITLKKVVTCHVHDDPETVVKGQAGNQSRYSRMDHMIIARSKISTQRNFSTGTANCKCCTNKETRLLVMSVPQMKCTCTFHMNSTVD
jgi:hypothetical protein